MLSVLISVAAAKYAVALECTINASIAMY